MKDHVIKKLEEAHKRKFKKMKDGEEYEEDNPGVGLLKDVILGGQDGIVNTLGVILGVAAASNNVGIVIAGGLAAAFAESISMGAVAYTSTLAEYDHYRSQLHKELNEIRHIPEMEAEEVRHIYRNKGFSGDLLEQIVNTIVSNEKVWLDTMMRDELHLIPVDKSSPLKSSFIVGASAFGGSLIPLVPFFFLQIAYGIGASIFLSALTLFAVGFIKAQKTIGSPAKSGLQIMVIGIVSALVGYLVGYIVGVKI